MGALVDRGGQGGDGGHCEHVEPGEEVGDRRAQRFALTVGVDVLPGRGVAAARQPLDHFGVDDVGVVGQVFAVFDVGLAGLQHAQRREQLTSGEREPDTGVDGDAGAFQRVAHGVDDHGIARPDTRGIEPPDLGFGVVGAHRLSGHDGVGGRSSGCRRRGRPT